jgi:hypothetical protein
MEKRLVRNSEGEPMYVENVRDQYEEEEAWCEEMQMRAEDPLYAASQENEYWYNQALACFEEKGIEVPYDVVRALQRELRNKQQKIEEERALKEAEPTLNYLNEKLPHCKFYSRYIPESYDEVAQVEIDCENRPYAWELAEVIDNCQYEDEKLTEGVSIEDYFSLSECKTIVHGAAGRTWGRFVRSWTAEEHCGQDFLFALSKRWLDNKEMPNVPENERYLQAIWHISPDTDAYGNSLRDEFRKAHPADQYIIWSGEIRHNDEFDDTICFHWS